MRTSSKFDFAERHSVPANKRLPQWGNLIITGSAVGGVLAIALALEAWFALPPVRPFLVGVLVVGAAIGTALWWRHR